MTISQAIDKLQRIKNKYGDLDFVEQSPNDGIQYIDFYLKEAPKVHRNDIIVCIVHHTNPDVDPDIGDETEGYVEDPEVFPTPTENVNDEIYKAWGD